MSEIFGLRRGESLLIIGLGRSGLACVEVLSQFGVTLYATDEESEERLRPAIATAQRLGAQFVPPADLRSILGAVDCAVLSPGVGPTSPVVRRLHERNVPVVGEIELAYRLCSAPIIAVTGTKGKSTTTALIGHLLRACGRDVRVGGNIGNPLIKEVGGVGPDGWVVAEVSSFQLETIRSFKPRVAVLLNLSPDHLDRYHSMEEYAQAKYRIAANQGMTDWFVGDLDDPYVAALDWRRGETRVLARQLWLSLDHPDQAAMYLRDDTLIYAPPTGDPRPIPIVARDGIRLPGEHNLRNAMAALLAALAVGCEAATLREAIGSFEPMSHRLQTLAEIDGVTYVDDSKSTTPASVIAALRTFDRPVILIAGGRSKGTSFSPVLDEISGRGVRGVIAIGEAAPEILGGIQGVTALPAASLEEAVDRARELAQRGDVVLLSPGCASFDMFASAEARGDRFADAVAALRAPAGA
ncbi:MAG: UDP-N-acetylmuramoyl-L-alanine--D-glutamate ligase [Candidatus Eremiobacteraeota bacterium]|nr:UDP-N-acetylmuramoyl-L-alanine--D-glutamate ligase [Candidatus Eremiobacteraeota bacterium]MBV9057231.1 UDP-N-acetylmuramoyl-L-alanine--D-glutamate ligase [Candidatus Eremiobacteraeota bacterium]MBV9699458.1 UDP-N-acetylmuramoyl-L-alanine--D-glutamate ligase [Candidatus Eremiobacteraeota bacterium]